MRDQELEIMLEEALTIAADNPSVEVKAADSRSRRLVNLMDRVVPKFWEVDAAVLAEIYQEETGPIVDRILRADPNALGLAISAQRPTFEARYKDPDQQEWLRRRDIPFGELIEEQQPGLLTDVNNFVEQLRGLGLVVEFTFKRMLHSVEKIHDGLSVSLGDPKSDGLPILFISGAGKITVCSSETGATKLAFIKCIAELSINFETQLEFEDLEGLFTGAEMQSIVLYGGHENLYEALSGRPSFSFCPYVAIELSNALPARADHLLNHIIQLLKDIAEPGDFEMALRDYGFYRSGRLGRILRY